VKKYFGFLSLLVAVSLLVACNSAADQSNVGGSTCATVDYGNGVFYFSCSEASFGNALSKFKEGNPSLRVTAIAGDGTAVQGKDRGYFISVESR